MLSQRATVKVATRMNTVMELSNNLEGRDKLTKFCQYSSRGLAYVILTADPKSVLGQRLTALYRATQAARKAFRVGKSINYFPKIDATLTSKTLTQKQQVLTLVQDIGMCTFFLFDNMQFFGNSKILPFDAVRAGERGGYFWFCANVAGFILAYESLKKDLDEEMALYQSNSTETLEIKKKLNELQEIRYKKSLTLLKIICDLIVSSNTSGIRLSQRLFGKKLNDGIIGFVGCISASIVLYKQKK